MEEKIKAKTFYERLQENLGNNKKVKYNTIRYVSLAMAICDMNNWGEHTYIEWIELLEKTCYTYIGSFYCYDLKLVSDGLQSLATALERERKGINNK